MTEMKALANQEMVVLAKIGSTYGLIGELKLYVLSESVQELLSYEQWWIKKPNSKHWHELKDEEVYRHGSKLLIKIAGIHSPEEASFYTNAEIAVPRKNLPELSQHEHYWVDMVGLSVENEVGDFFGKVSYILETGANDVLVLKKESSDAPDSECLIPFVAAYILDVDYNKKRILVDWQFDYNS
jgi:16S rRNA processing protein RimM